MHHLSSGRHPRILHPLTLSIVAPLTVCTLLLAGCSGGEETTNPTSQVSHEEGSLPDGSDEPASDPEQTSQETVPAPHNDAEDSGNAPEEPASEDHEDAEVGIGDVKVGTQIPDEFPDDVPLPEKAPTSVVTIGQGAGTVGGGWSLNYDGVSMDEVEHMLQQAEAAGYTVGGPFNSGSSSMWGLSQDKLSVQVLFSEDANLSITVTTMP